MLALSMQAHLADVIHSCFLVQNPEQRVEASVGFDSL